MSNNGAIFYINADGNPVCFDNEKRLSVTGYSIMYALTESMSTAQIKSNIQI